MHTAVNGTLLVCHYQCLNLKLCNTTFIYYRLQQKKGPHIINIQPPFIHLKCYTVSIEKLMCKTCASTILLLLGHHLTLIACANFGATNLCGS